MTSDAQARQPVAKQPLAMPPFRRRGTLLPQRRREDQAGLGRWGHSGEAVPKERQGRGASRGSNEYVRLLPATGNGDAGRSPDSAVAWW